MTVNKELLDKTVDTLLSQKPYRKKGEGGTKGNASSKNRNSTKKKK